MEPIAPKQILRRALFSRAAFYRPVPGHGVARSHLTRALHVMLILSIINQLLSSAVMSDPFPGDPPSTLFALHEYVGMASLGIVTLFWLWVLVRHGETKLGRLLPWFSPSAIRRVLRDALAHAHGLLRADPFVASDGSLASAVHGLGLLVASAMATTGTAYYVTTGSSFAHDSMELHRAIANLMWAYLIGHAALAVLHHLLGHDIVKRMFWIRRGTMLGSAQLVTDRDSAG